VDSQDDYQRVVTPFVNEVVARKERLIYLWFGRHMALLEERPGQTVYRLQTENSFEFFSTQYHRLFRPSAQQPLL
jgi:hypothetical protein